MAWLHAPLGFYAGDNWEIAGPLHYADGSAFNLGAGAVLEWVMEDDAGNVILSASLGSGISVTDLTDAEILIALTPAQTAVVTPGTYRDQLRATDPAGFVSTQWAGSILVRGSLFS